MHTRFQQRLARLEARPRWWLGLQALVTIALALVVRALTSHDTAALLVAVNSYEVVDWLMQESLDLLVNKIAIGPTLFNTEVQREFEHDFAPGETVRVKYPQEYLIRDGLLYSEQPINRRHTTVSCNQIFGIDFGWDSFEQALKMERGDDVIRREYLDPAMSQLAQEIESRCAQWAYQNASTIVGVLGTDPTTFDASSAAARQKLVELGCPAGKDRGIFVPPSVMRALKNANISYFNPVSDISKMMRTGIVGYGDGFDWYESVSLYSHTAGTWAGAVTVNGAGQSGTSLTITATAGDTFKLGDKFSTANVNPTNPRTRRRVGSSAKTFTITQALTAAGGGADVLQIWPPIFGPGSQYQNVDALPANSAALTLWPGTSSPNGKSGTVSLAGMSDALALVAVEFDNPKPGSVEISKQLKDDETGITISFVRAFDPVGRRWINRFDTCLGFGNLWSDNCLVALAGA
jgi:hypothetical protein